MNSGHKLIKQFNGHSGSQVSLKEWPGGGLYVEKIGNTERNVERLSALKQGGFPVPEIYLSVDNHLIMEYLHGLDMKTYLIHNNIQELVSFITKTLNGFSKNSIPKDYTETYQKKLQWLEDGVFPFTKDELIDRLPKILPQSIYHGDMTLENILFADSNFYLIDAVTTEYDSYIFDIAKMRQDLECKWFLRNTDTRLDTKLQSIQDSLKQHYDGAFNDNLLILMLLRVIQYCDKNDSNYNFLMKEIDRLWK